MTEIAEDRASTERPTRDELMARLLAEMTGWRTREQVGALRRWLHESLSLAHLGVLTILEVEGQLPMGRLADALDVSVASATGIVDRIERRGFVERVHGTDDRRLVLVRLTDAGRGVFEDLEQDRRRHFLGMLEELSDDELADLLRGLRAMIAAGRRHRARHGGDPNSPA
jgi:DNA-binding MarR family transcriptional regulator